MGLRSGHQGAILNFVNFFSLFFLLAFNTLCFKIMAEIQSPRSNTDSIREVSYHSDTLIREKNTHANDVGERNLLYALYALIITGAGVLILMPATFILGRIGATTLILSLSALLLHQGLSRHPYLRVHSRYLMETLLFAAIACVCILILALLRFYLALPSLPLNSLDTNPIWQRFAGGTYLYWVFLPAFVICVLRAFRGWPNVLKQDSWFSYEYGGWQSPLNSRLSRFNRTMVLLSALLMLWPYKPVFLTGFALLVVGFVLSSWAVFRASSPHVPYGKKEADFMMWTIIGGLALAFTLQAAVTGTLTLYGLIGGTIAYISSPDNYAFLHTQVLSAWISTYQQYIVLGPVVLWISLRLLPGWKIQTDSIDEGE